MLTLPKQPGEDVVRIKVALLSRLDGLVEYFFAARSIIRTPHEYRIGNNGSLSIRRGDGAFFDHETTECGDILALIQYARRCGFREALQWAQSYVGGAPVTACFTEAGSQRRTQQADDRDKRRREKALALLARRKPIAGTLAERYLREHRGITLAPLPDCLAFLERVHNHTAPGFFPAMIALLVNLRGEAMAAHVTFLDPDSGGKITGVGIKPRLIFGPCRGAAIHLGEATDRLIVAEGVEDGLSLLEACPGWPVWATGGISGLLNIVLPERVREVVIAADADGPGLRAAYRLVERLTREGRTVKIALPPAGFKDFNAAHMAGIKEKATV